MRKKRVMRVKPSWTDLHMVAKYALLDSAESQGWDWKTVQGYIARLPKDDPALNALRPPSFSEDRAMTVLNQCEAADHLTSSRPSSQSKKVFSTRKKDER